MAIFKNVSGQKTFIYAHDKATDAPKTGDAANITAQISIDGGTSAATNDTNPTELDATDHPGVYYFDHTQAETNGNVLVVSAVSSTGNVSIEPVIQSTFPAWANNTTPPANVTQLGGDADALATFAAAIGCIGSGTVDASATTTSIPLKTLNVALADVDQLKGRILIFPGDAGTGLKLQATEITAVSLSPDTLTVTALTRAPAEDEAFIIQ